MSTTVSTVIAAGGDERSFSTHPRNRCQLSEKEFERLCHDEDEMAGRLEAALESRAARVAFVARSGSDLTGLRFEREVPFFTHVGIALRKHGAWSVHQLLNTHEGPLGNLYSHSLVEFFRDDPYVYRARVTVPSEPLQERVAEVLASSTREALHTTSYSRVSYPFATRYQSCNQWVVEILGAAQSGEGTREAVQTFLEAQGLEPSRLRTFGLFGQALGRLVHRNVRLDDHPLRDRVRGLLSFMMPSSVVRYLRKTDDVKCETDISLGTHTSR
jgi:hypothetical protein